MCFELHFFGSLVLIFALPMMESSYVSFCIQVFLSAEMSIVVVLIGALFTKGISIQIALLSVMQKMQSWSTQS